MEQKRGRHIYVLTPVYGDHSDFWGGRRLRGRCWIPKRIVDADLVDEYVLKYDEHDIWEQDIA